MKRNLIILIISTIALTAMGQSQSIGLQVGFCEPLLRQNTANDPTKKSNVLSMNGGKVGFVYDATLVKGFGFSMALNYGFTGQSGKWQQVGPSLYPKQRISYQMHTIELPIDWQYKFQIAQNTLLIVYTGPTIQYNFLFNEHTRRQDLDPVTKRPVDTDLGKTNRYAIDSDGDGVRDYTPLNILWGVGAGFQYKNYYLRGGYDFGIYSHYRDGRNDTGDYANHARFDQWGLRLGWYFLNF